MTYHNFYCALRTVNGLGKGADGYIKNDRVSRLPAYYFEKWDDDSDMAPDEPRQIYNKLCTEISLTDEQIQAIKEILSQQ